MAPLLKILIELLPSLPGSSKLVPNASPAAHDSALSGTGRQQQCPLGHVDAIHGKAPAALAEGSTISSISWGKTRLDVFGLTENNLTHKFWDGYQWNPTSNQLETLGNGLATPPVAITWGVNRLDVFGLDDHNTVKHQYWDGVAWRPNVAEFENRGNGCDPQYAIAANTWGKNRLDIFCTGPGGDLLHQYYDGSQWRPDVGSMESLGGQLESSPSVVSWGTNRFDVFGVTPSGDIAHLTWDGTRYSQWEVFSSSLTYVSQQLAVTTWGVNRLDVYAIEAGGGLHHTYWDGTKWVLHEDLGGQGLVGSVDATSWSANRLDIVAKGGDAANYWYKYYDGQAWRPDVLGWYNKGSDYHFSSNPSVVSWGKNRLDIFGVRSADELLHQAWTGSGWYPSVTSFEALGANMALVNAEAGGESGEGRKQLELL